MTIPAGYRGSARRMTDKAIARVAFKLGCGEDAIHAILDVEARGSGFDEYGRPAMLFEPHIFYRNLSGRQRDAAIRAGIAYPKWRKGYPRDSYPRLAAAVAINPEAAYRSASWGLSQILGENFKEAGFRSAALMVEACCESEDDQLGMMAAVVQNRGLQRALKSRDWAAFAMSWNGSGYKENAYDTRLAARFAWWQRKPDTPWTPEFAALETSSHDIAEPIFVPPPIYLVPPTQPFLARIAKWWHGILL